MVLDCKWEYLVMIREKWLPPEIMETFTGNERRKWLAAAKWENGDRGWLMRTWNRNKRLVDRMEYVTEMLEAITADVQKLV